MADAQDEEFDKAFEGFGDDKSTPTAAPAAADPVDPPKEDPTSPASEEPKEEPKKDEPAKSEDPKKPEEADAGTPGEDPKKEEPKSTEVEASAPAAPEAKPLTEQALRSIINEVRTEERVTTKNLETATEEVLEAYYPDGLSNVLIDQATGKELRTPQDVVDASGGEMSTEEAAQWLMNEQYKVDQNVAQIRNDAKAIAETTVKFKQDAVDVLQRYEPIFKAYPQLQQKIWNQYSKLVKADESKNVILSAPDMSEFYDTVLEPYRLAFEYQNGQPGTAPVTEPAAPAPVTPGAEDRLDEGGDGGTSAVVNDPNDFAQQVSKELAKEL